MNASMQYDAFHLPFDEMSSSSLNEYNGDGSFALGEIMQQKSVTRFEDVTPSADATSSVDAALQGMSGEDAGDAFPDSRNYLESVYDSIRNSLQRQEDNDSNERSMAHDQLLQASVSESGHMSMAQQSSANLRVAAIWHTKSKLYVIIRVAGLFTT
jgi:hypothetical protein